MLTIRDIAKKANVSVATISRYLDTQKKALVHPETQTRIEKIIRKFKYVPNQSARALSRQRTNNLGMVTAFSTDVVKSTYYEGLIAGIIQGISASSYDLKWIMIRDHEIAQCNAKDLIQKHGLDGAIFFTWQLFPKLASQVERCSHLPMVVINDYTPHVRSSIVYCDSAPGVYSVCSHFAEKNYKTAGMFRGPEYISWDVKNRFSVFKKACKKLRLATNAKYWYQAAGLYETEGYNVMKASIKNGKLPRAIFCANDDLAHGTIRALKEARIRVPEDVAVVGFDDSPKNEFMSPPLTSAKQPLEAMGKAAVETLIQIIDKKNKTPIQIKFKPELVIRESA